MMSKFDTLIEGLFNGLAEQQQPPSVVDQAGQANATVAKTHGDQFAANRNKELERLQKADAHAKTKVAKSALQKSMAGTQKAQSEINKQP